MKIKRIFIPIMLLFLFSGISCKVAKTTVSAHKELSLDEIYDNLKKAELGFNTLEIRFNVNYENGNQKMSMKGNLKIFKDSIIWLSLSPGLGIEGARIMFTKDSLFILDRINKNLTKGKYEYLNSENKVDVDYHSLQSILTNHFFIYPTVEKPRKEFIENYFIKNDSTNLEIYSKNSHNVESLIQIDQKSFKALAYLFNDIPNVRNLAIRYQLEKYPEGFLFPGKIKVNSLTAGKFLMFDLDYIKVILNSDLSFPFKMPSGYKVINK